MGDDRHFQEAPLQLTETQAQILRKHLTRQTLSLDDAAILLGVEVEDLASQFQGRRATRGDDDDHRGEALERGQRRAHPHRGHAHSDDRLDEDGAALHAPERRAPRPRGNSALWAGGILAGITVVGGLALLSGIPQSLLFPPRGVSEFKEASSPGPVAGEASVQGQIAEAPAVLENPSAQAVEAPGTDGLAGTAEQPPLDPSADPAATDPSAVDPSAVDPTAVPAPDAMAAGEVPVPPAPEEVAPAVAVAQAETAFDPSAATPDPAPDSAPAPVGPTTALYAARAAAVRDAPTASGSTPIAQLKRGDTVSGPIVTGADGKSSWMHIESGPGVGGYVSVTNMADGPRPPIVQAIGQPRALIQASALHAGADAGSATLDTLSPGITVFAAAEVAGGWIEIHRRAGGVGYVRKEAFE